MKDETERDHLLMKWPVIFAITLTFVNDQFLKQSHYSRFLTGKLSDFAGLFFFPFLVYQFINISGLEPQSMRLKRIMFILIALMTAAGFFLLKTSDNFISLYSHFHWLLFGIKVLVTKDLSDLCALISLVFAYEFFISVKLRTPIRFFRVATSFCLGLFVSISTPCYAAEKVTQDRVKMTGLKGPLIFEQSFTSDKIKIAYGSMDKPNTIYKDFHSDYIPNKSIKSLYIEGGYLLHLWSGSAIDGGLSLNLIYMNLKSQESYPNGSVKLEEENVALDLDVCIRTRSLFSFFAYIAPGISIRLWHNFQLRSPTGKIDLAKAEGQHLLAGLAGHVGIGYQINQHFEVVFDALSNTGIGDGYSLGVNYAFKE